MHDASTRWVVEDGSALDVAIDRRGADAVGCTVDLQGDDLRHDVAARLGVEHKLGHHVLTSAEVVKVSSVVMNLASRWVEGEQLTEGDAIRTRKERAVGCVQAQAVGHVLGGNVPCINVGDLDQIGHSDVHHSSDTKVAFGHGGHSRHRDGGHIVAALDAEHGRAGGAQSTVSHRDLEALCHRHARLQGLRGRRGVVEGVAHHAVRRGQSGSAVGACLCVDTAGGAGPAAGSERSGIKGGGSGFWVN